MLCCPMPSGAGKVKVEGNGMVTLFTRGRRIVGFVLRALWRCGLHEMRWGRNSAEGR